MKHIRKHKISKLASRLKLGYNRNSKKKKENKMSKRCLFNRNKQQLFNKFNRNNKKTRKRSILIFKSKEKTLNKENKKEGEEDVNQALQEIILDKDLLFQ